MAAQVKVQWEIDAKQTPDRQLPFADRKIDGLLVELYGLTEEEIAIVAGRTS